ncbi:MAG TPA: efflux RND transporter periplasmic adaptor subunit [Acidobacteriaceae bacterium]|jgi:multidrug efflux system membrane fusion protein
MTQSAGHEQTSLSSDLSREEEEINETRPIDSKDELLRRVPAYILCLFVLIGLIWFFVDRSALQRAELEEQDRAPVIKVATAYRGDIGSYIEALGTVTPVAGINLYPQISGRIDAVHYVEGQMVQRGDPILDIDPRPYQAQLEQVQGSLQRDKGLLRQAEMDLSRYQEAFSEQAIARQTLDDQRELVEQYKGTVRNDVGQVDYAQVQLSYCHITAPIDGRLGLRLVDPGNTAFAGGSSPLAVLTQLRPITVVFSVAEDFLPALRAEVLHHGGLQVDAYDRELKKKLAVGRLLTLDNQIDTSTGTVRFRAQFDNSGLSLYPNQFVNARLLVKTLHNVTLIPTGTIQRNGTETFVYVISAGVSHLHKVAELATEGSVTAVSNLNAGDIVATTGFDRLQDGAPVLISSGSEDSDQDEAPNAVGRKP